MPCEAYTGGVSQPVACCMFVSGAVHARSDAEGQVLCVEAMVVLWMGALRKRPLVEWASAEKALCLAGPCPLDRPSSSGCTACELQCVKRQMSISASNRRPRETNCAALVCVAL